MDRDIFYNEDYFKKTYGHIIKDLELYKIYSNVSKKNLFKGIKIKNKKILEYGCGTGKNIYGLNNAVGFDISKFALDFCNKLGIETTKSPKKNYYDIIVCSHMLEHSEYPLRTLKKLKSYLKKNGTLILTIPEEKNIIPKRFEISIDNHLYNWNFQNLINLLLKAGFGVRSCNWIEQGRFYKILKELYLSNFDLIFNITKTIKKEEFRVVAVKE